MDAPLDPTRPFRVTAEGAPGLTRAQTRGARFAAPSRGVRIGVALPRTNAVRIEAAIAGAVDGAVVTDVAAAHAYGLPLPPWLRDLPAVSVAVAPGAGQPRRPDVRGRRLRLPEDHVTHLDGLRITTPARTWLDCAALIPLEHLVAMADAATRRGLTRPDELDRMTHWAYRRRGVAVARRAIPLIDPRAESPGESLLRVHLVLGGVPRPVCNHDVVEQGEWLARADLAWPEFRVLVEYDGLLHLDESRRRSDARRRNLLQERGWLVITATADDLRRPWIITDQVKAALRSRGWAPPIR